VQGLCPGEPFADQPAVAFCTGVLADWDLVLTAGHCVQAYALSDFVVVFGYFYSAPGQLAVQTSDIVEPVDVVGEAIDPQGSDPRLDFAWLRLGRVVSLPRKPAPVYVRPPPLMSDEPIVSIAAGGGIPMKVDADGRVQDPRASSLDYFVAETDTSGGASGGAAFDTSWSLRGVLARGGLDYVTTDAGCRATNYVASGLQAHEQYTYAHRAVEQLCKDQPSASFLCRSDCGNPCQAALGPNRSQGGCGFVANTPRARFWASGVILLGVSIARRVGRRRAAAT
jgi:hypothetical protein